MTRLFRAVVIVALGAALAACGTSAVGPMAIDLGNDACGHCRMAIVSTATAAQIVAPGDEAVLFDDIGCLRDFVAASALPADAVVYVADHRTGQWVDARAAVFTKTTVDTPMGSGLLAHADTASRDQDAAAKGGTAIAAGSLVP
jgi:copper chaperone NosL